MGNFRRSWHLVVVFGGGGFPVVRRMLTLVERGEISRGLAESLEYKEIAVLIGRDPSVVSWEVARHGGREGCRAVVAERAVAGSRARPKVLVVDRDAAVRARVLGLLRIGWSPASIASRLARDHGRGQAGRVSHEAVCQWV